VGPRDGLNRCRKSPPPPDYVDSRYTDYSTRLTVGGKVWRKSFVFFRSSSDNFCGVSFVSFDFQINFATTVKFKMIFKI
jgi:hypothetical protein